MPPPIPVELVPHDPGWALDADRIARQLTTALADVFVDVHHVGSTSIAGILAKPIVDLVPVARDLVSLDHAQARLEALGYAWWGEHGLQGRRYATLDDASRTRRAHLHCYVDGSPEITRHLAFRDYLRAHPDVARAYEADKIRARALCAGDSLAYSNEKSAWIQRVQADALVWADALYGASTSTRRR